MKFSSKADSTPKFARLADLSLYSPWPKRLLGIDPWEPRHKTREEILREYDREKWGTLLEKLSKQQEIKLEDVIKDELGEDRLLIVSEGKRLLFMRLHDARIRYLNVVSSVVSHYFPASALIELGAGSGEMVLSMASFAWANGVDLIAADCCPNAVSLAKLLAEREKIKLQAGACDLCKKPLTTMNIPPESVIFTSYAASCIPKLDSDFIESISLFRPKAVIHFEPCYEHCQDNDILNLMRRRYIEINGYNRNLATVLGEAVANGDICMKYSKRLIFGMNPLFSASCFVWTPSRKKYL